MDIFSRFRVIETQLEEHIKKKTDDNAMELLLEIKNLSKKMDILIKHVMSLNNTPRVIEQQLITRGSTSEEDSSDGLIFIDDEEPMYIPNIDINKKSVSRVSKQKSSVSNDDMSDAFDMLDQLGG